VNRVDLHELSERFRGKQFRELIQHHVRKQSIREIAFAIEGIKTTLGPLESKVCEKVTDYFNILALEQNFWRSDCAEILIRFCWLADRPLERGDENVKVDLSEYTAAVLLKTVSLPEKDKHGRLFSLFQLLVLNYAFMAHEQKKFRRFAGIRKGIFDF